MWQFTFFSVLHDLLLIEHFYTWHDFRAEGSWQQVLENEPRDLLRLCFLSSRISLPFCSLSCFFHLSALISVRSGSFSLDLCLIVLWNTIYPSLIRWWEPGLQTPHRPPLGSFCWCSATAFFSLFSEEKVAKFNKESGKKAPSDHKVIIVFPEGSCRNSSALHKSWASIQKAYLWTVLFNLLCLLCFFLSDTCENIHFNHKLFVILNIRSVFDLASSTASFSDMHFLHL